VPTTLLARQHFATFAERFKGLPVRIAQASRLIAGKELNAVKAGIKEGNIDIVIGTHALLGKAIGFKRLGLLIVDEEQHFGVAHLEEVAEFLAEAAPELKVARAHGQLPSSTLEDVMTAFYDGKYDVLLSTAIVESGLDIPNANTLIVHRADMFGLAQLYQLRG